MAEEPSEASVSSISIEDDVEPSVTRERRVVSILDKLKASSSNDLSRKIWDI